MGCPARKKIEKKFLFFKYKVDQEHEWGETTIRWEGLWWNINRYCEFCELEDKSWGIDDEQLMKWYGLTKCPEHNGQWMTMGNSYSLKELLKKYKSNPI
jgi:hypothetical protein